MPEIIQVITEKKIDKKGKVTTKDTIKSKYYRSDEPPFVKLYLTDVALWNGLPAEVTPILYQILHMMDKDNQVYLNSYSKKKICEKLNISLSTINNYITKLVKAKIMERISRGVFRLSFDYFSKRKWSEVKQIKAQLVYMDNCRKVKTTIDNK